MKKFAKEVTRFTVRVDGKAVAVVTKEREYDMDYWFAEDYDSGEPITTGKPIARGVLVERYGVGQVFFSERSVMARIKKVYG